MYSKKFRKKAILLRRKGLSFQEISDIVKVSKSTVSSWCSKIVINDFAKKRLNDLVVAGRNKSKQSKRACYEHTILLARIRAKNILGSSLLSKNHFKMLASMLFWGEGNKSGSSIAFTNSDPIMVKFFLTLLRTAYDLDESKLRALVHLHEYHDEENTLNFWSNICNLPRSQFSKSYLKPSSKKRKRTGYMGSIRLRYYDSELEKELTAIYLLLPEHIKNII